MIRTCHREHGEVFWAAMDQLQLSEDPDLLAPLSNALRGRKGMTREYTNIEPREMGAGYKDGDEIVVRQTRLFPREFQWRATFDVDLEQAAAELLKKGLKELKGAKQINPRTGEETKRPILTGCDAPTYQECLEHCDAWIRGAEIRGLEPVPDELPADVNGG